MQSEQGDSAYFSGRIIFRLLINKKGDVENVKILASSTEYPEFDNAILAVVKILDFPKTNRKTVLTFPYFFLKTKYPRGFVDTTANGPCMRILD